MKIKPFATTATLALGLALAAVSAPGANPAPAAGDHPVKVSTRLDRPVLVKGEAGQEVIIEISIDGIERRGIDRTPLNLCVVLDRSGSMTGQKLEQARQAAMMLVGQLTEDDIFSMVVYDSDVEVLIEPRPVRDRKSLQRVIGRIQPGGSTALYAGVKTGGQQLDEYFDRERINRVLLLSDGLANVGPKSNREIAELGHQMARRDISVSTIGLGEDYNEDLMTALAEASDANYYYVQDVETLDEIFSSELGELQSIVARRIVLEIRCPEGLQPIRFLGRDDKIDGQTCQVEFGQLAGRQNRSVMLECRLEKAWKGDEPLVANVDVAYDHEAGASDRHNVTREVVIGFTDDRKIADASVNREVQVEAEIWNNAAASERAIALADSNDVAGCRQVLTTQIGRLTELKSEAPAAQAEKLEAEIRVLQETESQLDSNGLSSEGRKAIQYNTYRQLNSKK